MTMPTINWQFARNPGWIDPRASFVRATTAWVMGPNGLLKQVPANTARFEHDPLTGVCLGYLSEPQRTNLLLRSQEFDNASWTKTSTTVTANTATAPDGTTTADTLLATSTNSSAAQAVTITAGRGIAFSAYLKPLASTWAFLFLSDGTNVIIVWFNLTTGAVGTSTAGAGTLLLAQAQCLPAGNGWYRCSIEATSATVTAISAGIVPCAADNTASANTNSLYAWGAQLEAEQARNSMTSYIPTTSATVTRNADNLIIPVSSYWFRNDAGSLVFDTVNLPTPQTYYSIAQPMYGGFGDSGAFVDVIYIYRVANSTVRGSGGSASGGSSGLIDRTMTWTAGASNKVALAWAADDMAMVVNGGTPGTDASFTLPVGANLVRMVVGGAPWAASATQAIGATIYRTWQYFPARLSNADLQALTAP